MSDHGIHTIDCQYMQPGVAAAYLMIEGDRAIFIENNTSHSLPLLLAKLNECGLSPEQVEAAIITHVHLDHAGGSSALLNACPNATLFCHPRAERHIVDPSRLIASARKVYGDKNFDQLYGLIKPIPSGRVHAFEDGDTWQFGSRDLTFLHTRGHANHHFCILDSRSNGIFTGDTFGIGYAAIQNRGGKILIPSTTPTEFDPALLRSSIELLRDTDATTAYLTHFGPFQSVEQGAAMLLHDLDYFEKLLEEVTSLPTVDLNELSQICHQRLVDYYRNEHQRRGINLDEQQWNMFDYDLKINAQGVAYVAKKRREG